MKTEDWLAEGNLTEAIAQADRDVSEDPQNASLSFLLFELLVLAEDFDAAFDRLRDVALADSRLSEVAEFYFGILNAERSRYNFLSQIQGAPQALQEPPAYGAKFINALGLLWEARIEEAEVLLDEAWKEVPKLSGILDGEEFTEIRDADDIIGPFLEAMIPEGYFWIPFEHIKRIEFKERQGYQDTIWLPAYIEMKGGIQGDLWIPSLYSGTGIKDDVLRLGQMTAWEYPSEKIGRVYGQRDIACDKKLIGIRQISTILFG
ncbi:type VI secretion system accessory protein TagJ [Aerosakkonema sp. BLCC-F183]|uniref:type VI secretion system accessory protein TagJ n=1 Tax=Aerosakkonema sp. BLCC-F183 TaxID=3342834 RepID=UPI0035BAA238